MLLKDSIVNDFGTGDNLTVREGNFTINEDAALQSMWVFTPANLTIGPGTTVIFDDVSNAGIPGQSVMAST